MGPLDQSASLLMRKYVKNQSLLARNAFPFELENECDLNVPARAVHCLQGNCESTWENDQDFVKWKEVQVLDHVLSIAYDWMENNQRPKWKEISGTDESTSEVERNFRNGRKDENLLGSVAQASSA